MKRNFTFIHFLLGILLGLVAVACAPKGVSTIIGGSYDVHKDATSYMVFPYGSVSIPGKWTKTDYNTVSHQQFFVNKDSGIAFAPVKNYEFNDKGTKTGFAFIKAFYDWESEYFISTYGLTSQIIEQDSMKTYLLWRLYGKLDGAAFDTYFLIGEKNGNASNFTISITNRWTAQEKISFFKTLFLAKKEE